MKIILPVAGMGTRLRPQTCFLPKALLPVGGNNILGHIIDSLKDLEVSQYIFVTGYQSDLVEEFVQTLNIPHQFVKQTNPQGLGEAIALCAPHLSEDEPTLIVLGDTLFEADLDKLTSMSSNVLCTRTVSNPERFGVAVADEHGTITQLVEKPQEFVSDQALVGIYWITDTDSLIRNLNKLIDENIRTRGEYQLTDGLAFMMSEDHIKFTATGIKEWLDCGKPETLIETNAKVLKGNHSVSAHAKLENCEIIEPCFIGPGVQAKDCKIGPNVSVFAGCELNDSVLMNSIIDQGSQITHCQLNEAILGKSCTIQGQSGRLSVGDHSMIGCEYL
jgi:glucose-1-phosphate thymidylyltransferase